MSGSAERLVEALEAVSANPEGVSVTEAARALSMSKAAASRLLASLAIAGLLERDSAQRYVLGLRLWEFGAQSARRLRIADISRSLLLETANETGARLHISVLRGYKAFFLEMTDFSQARAIPIVPAMPVVPAYACAPGKVLLGGQPDEALKPLLEAEFHPYTPQTITTGIELMELLRADEGLKRVPIMAVTAYAAHGDEERIRAAGATAYVSKPISVVRFAETVEQLLEEARASAANESGGPTAGTASIES